MKYTFVDNYDNFEDVKVGEVFSLVDDEKYPPTTLFMKLPIVKDDEDNDNPFNTCNAICLVAPHLHEDGSCLHYICNKQQVVIRDAELIVRK